MRRLSGAVLGALLVAVVGFAAPAAAHVTVDPGEAVQGGYARVVFRVPNERDNATVTVLRVRFPDEHPVPGVLTMPVPGWKASAKTRTLDETLERNGVRVDSVVSELTWRADSRKTGIPAGQFLEFPVTMGPLPETPTLVFSAEQTYSSGEKVLWGETPSATEEPEHPGPVLELAKAPTADVVAPTAPAAEPPAPAAAAGSGGTPLWLGVLGLVAGLVGLGFGVAAFLRTRERTGWASFEDEADEPDAEPDDDEPEEDELEDTLADEPEDGATPSAEELDERIDTEQEPPAPPRRPSPRPQTPP